MISSSLFFFLGASIGSFLAVVVVRFPERSIFTPRSHCDRCGQSLAVIDLLPIVSSCLQGFSCRFCGERYPIWYTVVEVICGGISLGYSLGLISLSEVVFLLMGLVLSLYDIKNRSYPLLIWLLFELPSIFLGTRSVIGLVFVAFFLLAQCVDIRIGSGDFLFLLSMSHLFSLVELLYILQWASLSGLVAYVMRKKKEALPFIPFLYGASIACLIIRSLPMIG